MEIKTNHLSRELDGPDLIPSPDKSPYLRRRAPQKLRKSRAMSRFWLRGIKLLAILTISVLAVGSAVSILVYAYSSSRLELRGITFVGCKHSAPKDLEQIIRQSFPRHILKMDLPQVRERLKQETWVRRVEIQRILPSEMVVYICERTPAVIIEIHGELMLADADGVVLDRYETKYGKLDMPVFRGLLGENVGSYRSQQTENSERVQLGLRMMEELESGSSAFTRSISEVDLSDKRNLRLLLVDDTAEIYLGDRDFLKRFRIFMENQKQYEELRSQYKEFASVDLRYDGQIIYRPRYGSGEVSNAAAEARN